MESNKKFTARQILDRLHDMDIALYERVLDTISDSYEDMSGCWEYEEDGTMVLLSTHKDE
jgi:hypothetical protein